MLKDLRRIREDRRGRGRRCFGLDQAFRGWSSYLYDVGTDPPSKKEGEPSHKLMELVFCCIAMWDAMGRFLEPPGVPGRCIAMYGTIASSIEAPEHGTKLGCFHRSQRLIHDARDASTEGKGSSTKLGCFPRRPGLIQDVGGASAEPQIGKVRVPSNPTFAPRAQGSQGGNGSK